MPANVNVNAPRQVACEPRLRDRWLPLVWSRRTERRLFLPHAEVRVGRASRMRRIRMRWVRGVLLCVERVPHR